MPRLFHRPPKYRLHKTTNQAVVSFFGSKIYLGPYGSQKSLLRYQEILKDWEKARHHGHPAGCRKATVEATIVESVTADSLRQKRLTGSPVTIAESILVYRRHTYAYYRKNGEVTREAGAIDDALRILRKHFGLTLATEFGPVALDKLRDAMIDELDWSRKYVNKQINRMIQLPETVASFGAPKAVIEIDSHA